MSTTTAPTYLYKDYVPQLIALLADVQAETFGVVRRIDEARYASDNGHAATARAFEFGTSLALG